MVIPGLESLPCLFEAGNGVIQHGLQVLDCRTGGDRRWMRSTVRGTGIAVNNDHLVYRGRFPFGRNRRIDGIQLGKTTLIVLLELPGFLKLLHTTMLLFADPIMALIQSSLSKTGQFPCPWL